MTQYAITLGKLFLKGANDESIVWSLEESEALTFDSYTEAVLFMTQYGIEGEVTPCIRNT